MFTHNMFALMRRLDVSKSFIHTLHRLSLLTDRECQVICHHEHSKIMDEVRGLP